MNYIAQDGGGKLHINDETLLDGSMTTINENPILYLAYMARQIKGIAWERVARKHADFVTLGKGRYIRRKGDKLRQSHDNILAWAWFSLHSDTNYAKEIYDWAKWRFFVYDPHHTFSLDPRCLLQGSHVFTLALAANKKPGWLTTIWFCGACLVTDHAAGPYLLTMLRSDIVRIRMHLLSPLKQKLVNYAMGLMEKRREGMARWYTSYYSGCPEHPAVLAARSNEYRGEN
jgi:hypothetical protein